MQQLFIADLHLSPDHPRLVRGFLDLLDHYQGKIDQLYILGDWFEAWIGDDDRSPWLDHIVQALKEFVAHGSQVFFMHGNRDFALGQKFMDRFGGQLIDEENHTIRFGTQSIVLSHGDALCTDDKSYQRFRKIIRNKLLLSAILALPLTTRRKIAELARKNSKTNKTIKNPYIMDVNEQAVQRIVAKHHILLHGHTHRPAIHEHQGKKRYVLGDWREDRITNQGTAVIALLNETGLQLVDWNFS